MSRIHHTAAETFYVSTTGSNTLGDGTSGNPWASPVGAYKNLQRGHDLGGIVGHQIIVGPGVYTDSLQAVGILPGQCDVLAIIGDLSNPLNCILKPAANLGYAAAAIRGAQLYMDGFLFDESDGHNDIIVSAGQGGSLLAIGGHCQFSNIYPEYNLATAYDTGKIEFEGGFKLYGRTSAPLLPLPQCMLFAGADGQIQFNNNAGLDFQCVLELIDSPNFALSVMYSFGGDIDAEGLEYIGQFGGCPNFLAHVGGKIRYLRSDPMPGTTTYPGGPTHSGGILYDAYP